MKQVYFYLYKKYMLPVRVEFETPTTPPKAPLEEAESYSYKSDKMA